MFRLISVFLSFFLTLWHLGTSKYCYLWPPPRGMYGSWRSAPNISGRFGLCLLILKWFLQWPVLNCASRRALLMPQCALLRFHEIKAIKSKIAWVKRFLPILRSACVWHKSEKEHPLLMKFIANYCNIFFHWKHLVINMKIGPSHMQVLKVLFPSNKCT